VKPQPLRRLLVRSLTIDHQPPAHLWRELARDMSMLSMMMTILIRPLSTPDDEIEAVRRWSPHVTAVGPVTHHMQRQRIIPVLAASPRAYQSSTIQILHRLLLGIIQGMDIRLVPHPTTQTNIAMA
jgi:hypothetical protein